MYQYRYMCTYHLTYIMPLYYSPCRIYIHLYPHWLHSMRARRCLHGFKDGNEKLGPATSALGITKKLHNEMQWRHEGWENCRIWWSKWKNRENLEKLVQANVKLLKMLGSPIFVCCISLKNSIYNNQIGAYL